VEPAQISRGKAEAKAGQLALLLCDGLWQTGSVKTSAPTARGYFAIGVEGISKAVNLGNLLRSAHAFGASFVFTIGADDKAIHMHADTSKASSHVPLYHWRSLAELKLPKGCSLVGIEILDEAHDLPNFPHPLQAAYVLGPERGALSPELVAHCQHLVRIPAAFSLNVATAGAIVMYDRLRSLGRFGSRPVAERAEAAPPAPHVQGAPRKRTRRG